MSHGRLLQRDYAPSESGRRFFQFLDPVFEIVLIDSKLNEVSAQLCDRPLDPPAQMSKLAVNGVEAFELDFYRIETTSYRIKTRSLVALLSFYRIKTRSLVALLSFYRIKTRSLVALLSFYRIKTPRLTLLPCYDDVEPRNHYLPHRGGIAQPGVNLRIETFNPLIEALNLRIETFNLLIESPE